MYLCTYYYFLCITDTTSAFKVDENEVKAAKSPDNEDTTASSVKSDKTFEDFNKMTTKGNVCFIIIIMKIVVLGSFTCMRL